MAFYDGLTERGHKGRATDLIYLDLSKAFDMVPYNILVTKLESYRVNGWTAMWIRNWLDCHFQRARVDRSVSKWKPEMSDVPQGSYKQTNTGIGRSFTQIYGDGS